MSIRKCDSSVKYTLATCSFFLCLVVVILILLCELPLQKMSETTHSTVGANKKFTYRFRSSVILQCESFHSVFMESSVFCVSRLLTQQLLVPQGTGNFRRDIFLVRSKLSIWNKVERIAKTCRYNISKNQEKLFSGPW